MAIFKAIVAEPIKPGELVFWWQSDGKLRPRPQPDDIFGHPVGVARVGLQVGQLVEITESEAMRAVSRMTLTRTGSAKIEARAAPPPAPINRHIVEMLKRLKR